MVPVIRRGVRTNSTAPDRFSGGRYPASEAAVFYQPLPSSVLSRSEYIQVSREEIERRKPLDNLLAFRCGGGIQDA
jgi:hypothetical protein